MWVLHTHTAKVVNSNFSFLTVYDTHRQGKCENWHNVGRCNSDLSHWDSQVVWIVFICPSITQSEICPLFFFSDYTSSRFCMVLVLEHTGTLWYNSCRHLKYDVNTVSTYSFSRIETCQNVMLFKSVAFCQDPTTKWRSSYCSIMPSIMISWWLSFAIYVNQDLELTWYFLVN